VIRATRARECDASLSPPRFDAAMDGAAPRVVVCGRGR